MNAVITFLEKRVDIAKLNALEVFVELVIGIQQYMPTELNHCKFGKQIKNGKTF